MIPRFLKENIPKQVKYKTMKKNYLKPTTKVVKIEQQCIICTSATRSGYGEAIELEWNARSLEGMWDDDEL